MMFWQTLLNLLIDGAITAIGMLSAIALVLIVLYGGTMLYEQMLFSRDRRRRDHEAMMRRIHQIDQEYKELWR